MEGGAISAQIGHAGPVGQRRITGARPLAASSGFSPLGTRNTCMPTIYRGTHCVLVALPDRPGLRLVRPGPGH